jgi:PAS domain S-box-containing protein
VKSKRRNRPEKRAVVEPFQSEVSGVRPSRRREVGRSQVDLNLNDISSKKSCIGLKPDLSHISMSLPSDDGLYFAAEAFGLGIFVWDIPSDWVDLKNERIYELFGTSRDGSLWTSMRFKKELLHPQDTLSFELALAKALQDVHSMPHFVGRIFRMNDRAQRWMEFKGRVERAADGTPLRLVGVVVDITEQKRKEEELSRLNRTLKAHNDSTHAMMRATHEMEYLKEVCRIIVEDCGHAMVWIGLAEDDENKTVRPVAHAGFDDGYLETLHITWADTERGRGPTGTAIRTGKVCACRNMLTDLAFRPWREQALKRGYASSIVFPLMAENKSFGAVTIYSKDPDPFSDDEVKLLSELADDVSHGIMAIRLRAAHEQAEQARRQSEERYRSLVELSPDALFVNRNGRIDFLNTAALRLFGAVSPGQLLGQSPFVLFHQDYHPIMNERIRTLMSGQSVPLIEGCIVRLDGEERDVEISAGAFVDMKGLGIQVILRDITARKRAEEALRKAAVELARSNNDLEQFAYVASHDMKEPLRMVTGFMSLLQNRYQGKLDAKADEYISFAVDAASRMQELIDALLVYSRVGRGRETERVPVASAIERALGNLRAVIEESGAVVTQDPLPAIMVPVELAQVFQNLISNAIKFKGFRSPLIHIGVNKQEHHCLFSVKDNGIGIDAQFAERIFLMFQRLHTRDEIPGAGVGLAICKKIVEHYGGKIWVESQIGIGSTFYFTTGMEKTGRLQGCDEGSVPAPSSA